ncbi:MAG: hypothetical protein VW270_25825 [Candidatus Poseidoniales archaeon]
MNNAKIDAYVARIKSHLQYEDNSEWMLLSNDMHKAKNFWHETNDEAAFEAFKRLREQAAEIESRFETLQMMVDRLAEKARKANEEVA